MISAVVLTHNDAKTLERTLASLSWCDELIVIDDNSTDASKDIARKFTKNIFQHALADDFAAQRNFGLSKAHGEWILFVDSDEVVSENLRDEVKSAVVKSQVAGYYFTRQDWLWGRALTHGETAHVRLIRLAKKNAGTWKGSVHEIWQISGPVGHFTNPLQHFPHSDVAQFIDEINWYSTLVARSLYRDGKHTNLLEIIAKPLFKFFLNYFIRLGFLDGTPGILVAGLMSLHSFLVRGKLYLLWHPGSRDIV